MIGAKTNAADYARRLRSSAGRRQLGIAKALTAVAKSAQGDIVAAMRKVFDRPTAFTLAGTYIRPATPGNLVASVGIKNMAGKGTAAADYLAPQILGGGRNLKRFEKALAYQGYLPTGMVAVPGNGAKLDSNGNMSAAQIVQILSVLRAFSESGYAANRRARSARAKRKPAQYFVGRPGYGRLPLGVWQRTDYHTGSEILPVLIFVRAPQYKKLLDFYGIIQKRVTSDLKSELDRAAALAVK